MTTMTDLEAPEARDVRRLVEELDLRTRAFIDGAYVDAASGETFAKVNPATGIEIAQVAAGDAEDVDRAVRGARAAFESGVWSRSAPKQRKKVLTRFAALIDEHADELALLETIDMGKPIRDARRVDVPLAAQCIAYYGEAVDKVYDEVAPTDPSAVVMIRREPLGVVGAVVPWNFPLMMASWKIGPALADRQQRRAEAGRAVAAHGASHRRARRRGRAARGRAPGRARLRRDGRSGARPSHGCRHDRVHRLDRGREVLPPLQRRVEHEARRARMRWQVATRGARRLRRSRRGGAGGRLGRLLQPGRSVQRRLAAARARVGARAPCSRRVVAVAERIRPGDPLDPKTRMGAIVDDRQLDRVLGYIESGKSEGAELHLGGGRVLEETGGYFVEPTIFDAVSNEMTIAREEIFGPVLSTIGFTDEADALAIANDTVYGLAAAVWTSDVTEGSPLGARPPCRRRLGEHLRRGRHHVTLRRLQAVRLRPRQVDPRARQVHGSQGDLDPRRLVAPALSAIRLRRDAGEHGQHLVGVRVGVDVCAGPWPRSRPRRSRTSTARDPCTSCRSSSSRPTSRTARRPRGRGRRAA